MNKLKEIESKIVERTQFLNLDFLDKACLKQFIIESCIEYARSIIPTPEEVTKEFFIGNKTLTQVYIDRIDQDLQSLNN